jgi:hypothetical protein
MKYIISYRYVQIFELIWHTQYFVLKLKTTLEEIFIKYMMLPDNRCG